MPYSNFMPWRHGAALLVLAAATVAATPEGRARTQDAAPAHAAPAAPVSTASPPAPPAPPRHVAGPHRLASSSTLTFLSDDRGDASVLFDRGSTNMYGSSGDLREAQRARRGEETLWWIRKDGKRYAVRDAATIRQLQAAYAPVAALGRQQGELGEKQGRLGARQGELGAQQGAIAQRQAGLALAAAAAANARAQRDAGAAAAGPVPRTDDTASADAAWQMQALAKRQSALAEQQEGFARQQAALAQRQQVANATLQRDIERIVEQAIARGVAQPLP